MRSLQGQLCRAGHKVTYAWQQSVSDVAAVKADVSRDTQQYDLTQVFALKPRQTELNANLYKSSCDDMKLGFALARLSSKSFKSAECTKDTANCEDPAYMLLNDQTWTAVFSWLSTADLARGRVGLV